MTSSALDGHRLFVLPGDAVDLCLIPAHKKQPLRLGPGLRHVPPSAIIPTVAGQLSVDKKKNMMWIEYNGGRYVPHQGDLVLGTLLRSSADIYHVSLSPHTSPAVLPADSFERGHSRKTRPTLVPQCVVLARVVLANRHMDAELECVTPSTGKADGLGPLVGGMVFSVSLGLARRLAMGAEKGGLAVLEYLAEEGLAFETATGRNGRVWVRSESVRTSVLVGRALRETDEGKLGLAEQKRLVKMLVREKR